MNLFGIGYTYQDSLIFQHIKTHLKSGFFVFLELIVVSFSAYFALNILQLFY